MTPDECITIQNDAGRKLLADMATANGLIHLTGFIKENP